MAVESLNSQLLIAEDQTQQYDSIVAWAAFNVETGYNEAIEQDMALVIECPYLSLSENVHFLIISVSIHFGATCRSPSTGGIV